MCDEGQNLAFAMTCNLLLYRLKKTAVDDVGPDTRSICLRDFDDQGECCVTWSRGIDSKHIDIHNYARPMHDLCTSNSNWEEHPYISSRTTGAYVSGQCMSICMAGNDGECK